MIDFIVAILFLMGTHDTGWTSRYDVGVMQWQVDYHGLQTPCDDCAVAVSDCSLIGDYWLIKPVDANEWTPVVVADCAGQDALNEDGISWMDESGIIVELSYGLAEKFTAVNQSIEIEVIR